MPSLGLVRIDKNNARPIISTYGWDLEPTSTCLLLDDQSDLSLARDLDAHLDIRDRGPEVR